MDKPIIYVVLPHKLGLGGNIDKLRRIDSQFRISNPFGIKEFDINILANSHLCAEDKYTVTYVYFYFGWDKCWDCIKKLNIVLNNKAIVAYATMDKFYWPINQNN